MEQNYWEQIQKGTGHLEDIFMDASSVKHIRIFNPYVASTHVKMYHDKM